MQTARLMKQQPGPGRRSRWIRLRIQRIRGEAASTINESD